jgi:hypothetical protein
MATSRTDPYLWLHLSGLATVPLWLDGCLAGLAVGDPQVPSSLELLLLGLLGTLPALAMQLLKPFYLFSGWVVSLQPSALSPAQQQLLRIQRHWSSRGLALLPAAVLVWALVALYRLAPIANTVTPFAGLGRTRGWLIAAGCFALANLFLQVSCSALRLLLARPQRVAAVAPYPSDKIRADFSIVGLRVNRLLPPSWIPQQAFPSAVSAPQSTPPDDTVPNTGSNTGSLASGLANDAETQSDDLTHTAPAATSQQMETGTVVSSHTDDATDTVGDRPSVDPSGEAQGTTIPSHALDTENEETGAMYGHDDPGADPGLGSAATLTTAEDPGERTATREDEPDREQPHE